MSEYGLNSIKDMSSSFDTKTKFYNEFFLKYWQSAKFKLKMQKMLGGLNEELKIVGTTTLAGIEGMI